MILRNSIFIWMIAIWVWPNLLSGQERCGVPYLTEVNTALDPGFALRSTQTDHKISELTSLNKLNGRNDVHLPIVVHVVYNQEEENISDAQVLSQIEVLNADFTALFIPDGLPGEFADRYTDVGIRFCLASKDPNGLPTNGITRTHTSLKNIGLQNASTGQKRIFHRNLGGADGWDDTRYINIWVCRLDQFLGYATKPGDATFPGEDGMVIDYRSFGTLGIAHSNTPNHLGRTTTHEMGHYFGLLHLWGAHYNGCGDDFVEDTPTQGKPYYKCPKYPQTSCNQSNMFMNFMDYVDDACMHMFTPGQGARMRATLEGFRKGLLTGGLIDCEYFDETSKKLKDRFALTSNIARDQVTIIQDHSQLEVLYLSVSDVAGRVVYKATRISQKEITLNFDNSLAQGIYFLTIRTKNDQTTFKFLSI